MWKYVLPPVVFVGILWIAMSTATTMYMSWVENSYDRFITENLSSIQHADAIQDCLKRIEIILPSDEKSESSDAQVTRVLPIWRLLITELATARKALEPTAHSVREKEVLKKSEPLFDELIDSGNRLFAPDIVSLPSKIDPIHSPGTNKSEGKVDADQIATPSFENRVNTLATKKRMLELVNQINASITSIKSINSQLADTSDSARNKWGKWIGAFRTGLLIFGPLVGLFIGWRLARRLQKSVTKIAVTLKQANDETHSLGELVMQPVVTELGYMQHQSEAIVRRIKQIHFDLERTRREMTRSERLASVGRLASGVAHELRNPLTSVKLLLQNALRKGKNELITKEKLELILDEVGRMESTIDGLLDFSRERPIHATPHDILETIQRAFNLVAGHAEKNHIEIQFDHPFCPLLILGDKELLHQVFVNLILNAIESMPNGGSLMIAAVQLPNQRISVTFRDTGPGIPEDILPQLFEPFMTTKERGTGLGLAISRRIVDQHSGLLIAENSPKGGALFTLELPSPSSH